MWQAIWIKWYDVSRQLAKLATSWVQSLYILHGSIRHRRVTCWSAWWMVGDDYKLRLSSRRLVQRMTLTGKILHMYEFREDGSTRLFTYPWKTAENGNSDICVINSTSDDTGELIVLHRDGRVKATYSGQEGSQFNPTDIACDSKKKNHCIRL